MRPTLTCAACMDSNRSKTRLYTRQGLQNHLAVAHPELEVESLNTMISLHVTRRMLAAIDQAVKEGVAMTRPELIRTAVTAFLKRF